MYAYNLGIRFQSIVEQRARQTAIWFGERETVSYDDLNRAANRLARWLLGRGVTPREVVCLSGVKSSETFACMLACLKIGALYCVLDPDIPAERLQRILETCRPKLMLAERGLLDKLEKIVADLGVETFEKGTGQLARASGEFADANLPQTRRVTGAHPAYIMFTSGSTGFPKGAVMTHANVLNLVEWGRETFRVTPDDVLTNVNALYFDNSVFDFYTALFTGARLVPFSKEEVKDPKLLVEKIDAAGCTLWFSVPSLLIFLQTMRAADGKHLRSIRRFVFGGEGYPKAKLKMLYETYSDSSELFNVYGPTECTCICSSYKITADDFQDPLGLPPLGSIADNFGFLILDEEGRGVAAGETGELCLTGPNLGRGYYNDEARTGASFVQNPANDKFRELMYKTGDLVRLDPADGKLYIQGRRDNQIKHMGYRIELEEIEGALNRLDYVSEAAALHTSVNGLSRIVAVVAARQEFDAERARAELRRMIPDYMIPSVFHREEALPKNPNGKVDRKGLAEKYLAREN
ncbi:MAG: amino acid adenylation domain-containing protein [Acidobacteria bacterium]|nr:amino acid adenylation domain-containing protein [Acidobacteriota bacterium]MCA1640408.1 amino acid adenylation domain-containing protein [Acidobacteriota bacterium]